MILFKKANELSRFLHNQFLKGKSTGFVPTMGALHPGHLSLIKASKTENDCTVCSIFINPTQFNDLNDLIQYPQNTERDIQMLAETGNDILFLPDAKEIYPDGVHNLQHYQLGGLENMLEGASRPGHFQGVANVVDRLLEIVKPQRLYLGQKDFQQVKVIEKIVKLSGLPIKVVTCPIIREENGLAMSSRNVRLTEEQRKNAAGLYKVLSSVRDSYSEETNLSELKQFAIERLNNIPEAKTDYFEFYDADTFQPIHNPESFEHIIALIAVKIGNVRLLDNIFIK